MTIHGEHPGAGTIFTPHGYNTAWPQPYSTAYPLDMYGNRESPHNHSHEFWQQQQQPQQQHHAGPGNLISPVSASTASPTYWQYHNDNRIGSIDSQAGISYSVGLPTSIPPVTDSVPQYLPFSNAPAWESGVQAVTPVTAKTEQASPVTLLDSHSLSHSLSLHAKQSYIDAYWEYFHPLCPILHKPTLEQQRHFESQQSDSDLLLKAAVVICGTTFAAEESRLLVGRMLYKKAIQHIQEVSRDLSPPCSCENRKC